MNKQEFGARVLQMEAQLYRISCGLLREPQDRMDAVQEAVLKAWAGLDRLRDERLMETWLTRILINECHNLQRGRSRLLPMIEGFEMQAAPDVNLPLRDAIYALPEPLRLVILLHYMEGYEVREVAEILKIPEGTVKSRLRRARAGIKQQLDLDGEA